MKAKTALIAYLQDWLSMDDEVRAGRIFYSKSRYHYGAV